MTRAIILLLAGCLFGLAETAGGKWTYEAKRDEMTDGVWHKFTLLADHPIEDGLSHGAPDITITCGKGWRDTLITVPVIIGSDSVRMRADGKAHNRLWPTSADHHSFFLDSSDWLELARTPSTKEFLKSSDIRIEFEAFPGHLTVIRFSPAGINLDLVNKACGKKFSKL